MRCVCLKARAQFLKGFFLIPEKSEGWGIAIFGGIGGKEFRIFITCPVKYDQISISGKAGCGCEECGGE